MHTEWDDDVPGSGRMASFNYEVGFKDAMADCELQYEALLTVCLLSIAIVAFLFMLHVSSFSGMQANRGCNRLRLARFGARL